MSELSILLLVIAGIWFVDRLVQHWAEVQALRALEQFFYGLAHRGFDLVERGLEQQQRRWLGISHPVAEDKPTSVGNHRS